MKNIKIRPVIWCNSIISLMLTILGYTLVSYSCTDYGAPGTEHRESHGTVTSKTSGSGIPNIRVKTLYDSTDTDQDGYYKLEFFYDKNGNFPISFEDVDDTMNGVYQKMDTIVESSGIEWDGGFNLDVKLTPDDEKK
jgi:hypothetical protein